MAAILIVDDEPGVRSALGGVLRDEGYTVEAVESGEACLERLVEQEFDEESVEAVFADTVERLRQAGIRGEIDALNAKNKSIGLAPDEVRRLQQLLAQKQTVKPATPA